MTLSKGTRDAIGRTVRALRRLFEDEFGKQAAGRYGIRDAPRAGGEVSSAGLDAWLDPVDSLTLTSVEQGQREELVQALRYLSAEGLGGGEAVQRLIREAAFTAVNRLLAVRVAESVGVVPEVLARGRQSGGYLETVQDLFPTLAHDDDSYWTYAQVAGDELAAGVPRLFDRRHPASAFVPSRACVDAALGLLNAAEVASAWVEPEALGWAYQFFNGDDVAQMRSESAQPRTSRELAVRNQFFTPRYVVDWLVQNTLGRRLVQAGYDIDLPLLVGEVGDLQPLALEAVRVLDPAVGSGHFLLGCYDLLEQTWASTGVAPADAAPHILPCLFGVDIDPRAAQVAQAVLLLRARRAAPGAGLVAPTIVTAVSLPHNPELREDAFGTLSSNAQDLAAQITDALEHAPELGSLLKVEQRLASELARISRAPQLADDASEASVLGELAGGLQQLVSATSTPEERMFTAEAADALRFLMICQQRYDTVLMNPPFGSSPAATTAYLSKEYPSSKFDIYAAFIERGHALLGSGGYLGAITNRAGFFIKKAEKWRREVVDGYLTHLLDLGYGVLHEAMVEVAAYVMATEATGGPVWFRRGLRQPDKSSTVTAESMPDETYALSVKDLALIPGMPFSYWLHEDIRELFSPARGSPLVQEIFEVAVGASTKDDFQFLRLWWEIAENGLHSRWMPFAKGGEYAPVAGTIPLVVDWRGDGGRIADYVMSKYPYLKGNADWVLHRENRYGVAGLTYSRRTTSGFSVRMLPTGTVFSDMGRGIIPRSSGDAAIAHVYQMLAYGNSRLFRELLDAQLAAGEATQSGTAARAYEASIVGRLPWIPLSRVEGQVDLLWHQRLQSLELDETSAFFCGISISREQWIGRIRDAYGAWFDLEKRVCVAACLSEEARNYLAEEQGRLDDLRCGRDPDVSADLIAHAWSMSMSQLIDAACTRLGPARYLMVKSYGVDRRVELTSYATGATVFDVLDTLGARSHLHIEGWEPSATRARQLSYAVGRVFGRWRSLSEGASESPSIRELMTCFPNSPLLVRDGHPQALLVDDVSSSDDIARQVARVLQSEFEHGDGVEEIGQEIRDTFFAAHLRQYSASRRSAPIYWQLGVPSKRWGLWLYAPSLSRESLFAIARAAHDKLSGLHEQANQVREGISRDGGRREQERLEALEELCAELDSFSAIVDNVAQSGWEPDLNDGYVLNAAPLEELFVHRAWRSEVAKHRKALENGKYPWATVQHQYYGGGE